MMGGKNYKTLLKVVVIYALVVLAFRFVGGEQLNYKYVVSEMKSQTAVLEELSEGMVVQQPFTVATDTLDTIDLLIATYGRENQGTIRLAVTDEVGKEVASHQDDVSILKEGEYKWVISPGVPDVKGKTYQLVITSTCPPGLAPAIYYSDGNADEQSFFVNGQERVGQLCFDFVGKDHFAFGNYYWYIMTAIGLIIVFGFFWTQAREKQGKNTMSGTLIAVWTRYEFLIKQLVSRDFKTKYKRSVLGYLWSFLNPLLTMAIQYIVFSTIFRSGIKNFPVYLLTGIILFNFFTEAVGQGLTAIVGNASLITKVYVPKYIYPVTKVTSCSINLLISVIPLLIVTLLTGGRITIAIVLLPYVLLCLLIFCIGLSLLLSTAMVFFRDTQYLWGIVSLGWMYATPLFYPENIIPMQFRFIQTINPLYHYIRFARTILIDGVSPEPKAYIFCGLSAIAMCVIGATVFKKFQNKFVLYV